MIVYHLMPMFWKYSTEIADKFGYKDGEIVISIIFMLIMNTWNTLFSLPFSIYSVFVIEEKHGFNKQVNDTSNSFTLASNHP